MIKILLCRRSLKTQKYGITFHSNYNLIQKFVLSISH